MRTLFLTLIFILSLATMRAQSPQAINYQAVARTTSGILIPSQSISVRFSILDGNVNGNTLYQENHSTATNSYGLFTLPIGQGTTTIGSFSTLNWAGTNPKYLKVEISPSGGNNYTVQGTTQLLSVPYALYADKTNLVAGTAIAITNGNVISGAYTSGTGINVNGATISHALTAGTGINISGANISHALTAGTGININGANISHALQAGTGINISGATISHNLVAGAGINITGNVITNTGGTGGGGLWTADNFGQHSSVGNVGIGTNSQSAIPLTVFTPNSGVGNAGIHINSNDVWHTGMSMINSTSGTNYSLLVGGNLNSDVKSGNFAIFNNNANRYIIHATAFTNYVGIGSNNPSTPARSQLHVFNGDVNVEQIGSGIIMKSPNGQCWRVTVSDAGTFVSTPIACP